MHRSVLEPDTSALGITESLPFVHIIARKSSILNLQYASGIPLAEPPVLILSPRLSLSI